MDSEVVKITGVKKETPSVTTLTLDRKADAAYGQFYMIRIPGFGEKPYASSSLLGNMQVTVRNVGPVSQKLGSQKIGDCVGIRGPYGKGKFTVKGNNICFIAGGVGIVPLIPVIEGEEKKNRQYTVILGGKMKKELFFTERIEKAGAELHIVTDDGSEGEKTFPNLLLEKLLDKNKYDQIMCCGPEIMMKSVLDIVVKRKIPAQFSLERYMKCGLGICGSCAMDPSGELVCKEGPVFDAEKLVESEFGKYKRDASGSKTKL
jgi:dihydroorotate dehydrogenase electron transfer subunit